VSVIPINVPPLRERRDDVEMLATHFLKKYSAAAQKSILRIAPQALAALAQHGWPGNVRELENTIERAVALETSLELRIDLTAERPSVRAGASNGHHHANVPSDGMDFEKYVADIERALILSALEQSGGVQTRAAELLKVSYRSFRHLLKKYNI
jgi:two-component system response regulator PilR (NtrC family)